MRLDIKPTDRLHMLVWRTPYWSEEPWRASPALNGWVVDFGQPFETWDEAMECALMRVGEGR